MFIGKLIPHCWLRGFCRKQHQGHRGRCQRQPLGRSGGKSGRQQEWHHHRRQRPLHHRGDTCATPAILISRFHKPNGQRHAKRPCGIAGRRQDAQRSGGRGLRHNAKKRRDKFHHHPEARRPQPWRCHLAGRALARQGAGTRGHHHGRPQRRTLRHPSRRINAPHGRGNATLLYCGRRARSGPLTAVARRH